ncbi:hypothetical protein BCR34DRAFT_221188 [Clohesyomyces aquaticus]|uniref:Uncharacterized protein n=1 Tax=Clohesyomyces aquaticus TaxID=1231657 RepID=A0A1Y1Y9A2_9PLEO|nr:hypothetical protein BCR34DRAFT_221188 [Clohesyomyces aquaticus]
MARVVSEHVYVSLYVRYHGPVHGGALSADPPSPRASIRPLRRPLHIKTSICRGPLCPAAAITQRQRPPRLASKQAQTEPMALSWGPVLVFFFICASQDPLSKSPSFDMLGRDRQRIEGLPYHGTYQSEHHRTPHYGASRLSTLPLRLLARESEKLVRKTTPRLPACAMDSDMYGVLSSCASPLQPVRVRESHGLIKKDVHAPPPALPDI